MSLFDILKIKDYLQQLETLTAEESFWQRDPQETGKVLSQIKQLKSKIEAYQNAEKELQNYLRQTCKRYH